jgi:hypothetical protein
VIWLFTPITVTGKRALTIEEMSSWMSIRIGCAVRRARADQELEGCVMSGKPAYQLERSSAETFEPMWPYVP